MPRERELKYDLGDEATARSFEALLPPARAARWQLNRFFDTPERALRRARLALRLRGEWATDLDDRSQTSAESTGAVPVPNRRPDRLILSLKGPRMGQDGFHDREELQAEAAADAWLLARFPLDRLPAGWRERLPLGAGGATGQPAPVDLGEVARFANLRRTLPLTPRWQAEIDRTWFGDGLRSWELEVEIGPDDDPAAVRSLLAELVRDSGIVMRAQERSKLVRALDGESGQSGNDDRAGDESGDASAASS